MSYFNSEQLGEMARLAKADPKTLCFCGWWDRGACTCGCPPEFTHADRIAAKCAECGGYPDRPGDPAGHRHGCSHHPKPTTTDQSREA